MSTRLNHRLLLAILLLLALLVRIVPLTYSHFWDETIFLQHAKVILDGRTNFDEFFSRPPVLSIIYAFGFAIWDNIYVANLVQGVVTTLVVLFAFLYVRPAFGPVAALFGAFLFAFTPYLVARSHDLLTDMPALALMLAAMWLFDRPGPRFALLAGVVYALAIQTRFTSLFLIVYFALEAILSPKKLRNLALLVAGAAAAISPYLLWVRWNYGSIFFPFVMARRIVTEWTAPVPARFYWNALIEIFPYSMWLFFGVGVLLIIARWAICRRNGEDGTLLSLPTGFNDQTKRQIVLLLWGAAFLVYMLRIPHKEVRYLLPLAIPVVVISALGLAALFHWLARQTTPVRVAGLLMGVALVIVNYGTPFQKLMGPYVDRYESATVQIAHYLRQVSTPADTIYAAHEYPVLAFYSERRTVSLLSNPINKPQMMIQENFDQAWPDLMRQPGFLVYFHPDKIKEIHSITSLKPDRRFLENCPNFRVVQVFPTATVYRYLPTPGSQETSQTH
jgi:4-amino-4-deoxy-L-arabinose transferase-like glycosyltransferase